MISGTVKFFRDGWGFIEPGDPNLKDVFVHWKDLEMSGFKKLEPGDKVSFDLEPSDKGYKAKNVRVI